MAQRGPGDPGQLFEIHGPALYRFAVMLLADAAAAEDAVQQVFMALLRQRAPIENEALDPLGDILPGWKLTLDLTQKGYWFMIKDTTDACGYAFVSTQDGLIYTAQPLR